MRPFLFLLLGWLLHGGVLNAAEEAPGWKSSRFWFSRPAEWKDRRPQKGTGDNSWARDATPAGNGRIGALIYGGVEKDHLELTEISMWSGGYCSAEAKDKGPDSVKFGSYQPFGTLEITYPAAEDVRDYRRTLDVAEALASVSYTAGNVHYRREYFASIPHQVISMTVQGDRPRSVEASFRLVTLHPRDRMTATASFPGVARLRRRTAPSASGRRAPAACWFPWLRITCWTPRGTGKGSLPGKGMKTFWPAH